MIECTRVHKQMLGYSKKQKLKLKIHLSKSKKRVSYETYLLIRLNSTFKKIIII